MYRTLLAAALGVAAIACSGSTDPTMSVGDSLVLQVARSYHPGLLPADPVQVVGARIGGHHLILSLQHSGGCQPHEFAVVTGPDFGDSNPPYALFRLAHEANGDACEALLTRTLSVDLRPIETVMRRLGASAVRFNLAEPGDVIAGVGELVYTF